YVDLECTKTLYELAEWVRCTFNVGVSTSTIDRTLREFHYTLKRVTLLPEHRNTLSIIELKTNYATSFRELEVDNDFKLYIKEINETCQRQGILTPIFVMDNARIHHYRGLNDDEEIASINLEKFNEITVEHCSAFYRKILGHLQKAEVGQVMIEKQISSTTKLLVPNFLFFKNNYYIHCKDYDIDCNIYIDPKIMILIAKIIILIKNTIYNIKIMH
ncbi:hypothetical protein CWI37_0325p0010, partial [Hamiltosporidium tvaerminnensis]